MQNIKWGKVLVLLSLVGGIIALDMGIRPMVREAAASQTQIAVNRMIQRAVLEVLEEDGLRYQSFVSLQQNQSGETTALITDTVLINRLQGELLEKILQTLQQYRELKLELPLGSLTGIQFLAGYALTAAGVSHQQPGAMQCDLGGDDYSGTGAGCLYRGVWRH